MRTINTRNPMSEARRQAVHGPLVGAQYSRRWDWVDLAASAVIVGVTVAAVCYAMGWLW